MYRFCIYPSEIASILGKSYSHACKVARAIKDAQNLQPKRDVTIREFCDKMNLPYDEVFNMINKVKNKSA
ncbi:MAG: hypothetical protein GW839_13530 [Flavobacteriales bacterium]|nr:hypothetical protein [Flavobacteriales bacterium]PIV94439.1 MAG: hypothetical protein COW44_04215 [Flavobacteriaceae bacterium CG17_big_fil_post_rev_8_21_14_2_50_33_15]